ncbi:hypothetical protein [Cupriavidus taiwanensis]|uniref:Uncharacterized protein n=1 Tax=Cupriavidus taiwanensis TaxID=164546 RepID=A0A7Z7JGG9_9BURK|nr:hypothetical protein [Cupriavidus taiwanensis]SOZ19192.1 conserved hypothetical protein [Cupriavidus taiwanensis]SOZ97229.1 conserved hypothetical protein [Cupriavidus taiwanensis]SPC26122.1 conserved hypothetical protein [Cupriavidus taiwanensis]SPD37748.1 conserved protein of unknown function [Cupriavidus taiwanensis]
MRESSDQIGKLLRALSQNDDLISEAFDTSVELGDRARNARIDTLSNLKALKPQDEGVYRLNPRLRDFIADYLVSYRAYQTLTRLSGGIQQARSVWREIRVRYDNGDASDRESLVAQLVDTVIDISYSIERNLSLLHALISTQYGDVSNFQAKLRQNKFYVNEVSESLNEMEQVSTLFGEVESQALNIGMLDVRSIVRKRLTSRILTWTLQIKDVQAAINRSLFRAKLQSERVRKLSRVAHYLRQNKTASGFEVSSDSAPAEIFVAEPIPLAHNLDVRTCSDRDRAALMDALRRLPPRAVPVPVQEAEPALAIIDEEEVAALDPLEPHDAMVSELITALHQSSQSISLRDWKERHADGMDLRDEDWLLYASIQLESEGVHLTFVNALPADQLYANQVSSDILAHGFL